MSDRKYKREDCIILLKNKHQELKSQGFSRYPSRSDFEEREVVAIKAFFGPWPRALEAADIKPPRDDDRLQKNREKRIRAKRTRTLMLKAEERERKDKNSGIINAAFGEGFAQAEVISTDKIVFDEAFRPYCEENLCGQFGVNYSCPPDCGTPEEMKQKVLSYKNVLVVSTNWEIEDFSQTDKLKEAKAQHNAAMLRLIKKMKAAGYTGIMVGASGCTLCTPCKLASGEACEHPDVMYSCMSAYCIYVKKLAVDCSMNYDYNNKILPLFGMYLFNPL